MSTVAERDVVADGTQQKRLLHICAEHPFTRCDHPGGRALYGYVFSPVSRASEMGPATPDCCVVCEEMCNAC